MGTSPSLPPRLPTTTDLTSKEGRLPRDPTPPPTPFSTSRADGIADAAMASTSSKYAKHRRIGEDEEEEEEPEEELERFDDFTIASSWERFISEIEAICRQWLADGPKILMAKGAESVPSFENLYMVKRDLKHGKRVYCMEYHFMKSAKGKYSYWNDDTHSTQLSFGVDDFLIIAPLSASGVVLDDPESTKLLSSIAIALSNCGSNWPAFVPVHDPSRKAYIGIQNMGTVFTRRFEADRIASQVPIRLMHLEGLHELFLSKFVLSSSDFPAKVKVNFSMKLTYRTPEYEYDHEETLDSEATETIAESEVPTQPRKQWDDDCPWAEWYSAEDPVKGFELTAIWGEKMFEESLEMAEVENASSFDADSWLLHPVVSPYMVDDSIGKFVGFASQLYLLVNAFESSGEAQFLEDFVADNSGQDNSKSLVTVPPPSVIDRVMKDLFNDEAGISNYVEAENKHGRALKGAPSDSLFAQFCLHALWFGNCNIRVLWIDFVREIRWCWEESERLPRMKSTSKIDLSTCLIHQKLQMLAICIERKKSLNCEKDTDLANKEGISNSTAPSKIRKGSAGVVPSMMLINIFQEMHAPYTQDAPLMTEDMHEERLHAAEAFGNAVGLSGQLERDILSSDMSAFKAANPDAAFEDFIRWHSPGDWVSEEDKADGNSTWPPKGRLSQRMSEHGNMWRKIWNDAPALPVSEQKSLLDSIREGEKVVHYLETLRPQQLLEQMVCTAFKSSADILNKTSYGSFKLMKTKMDQLYATMASTLKSLQGKSDISDLAGDLKQLCQVFEHIEKLLIFAASVHRKLIDAPRLAQSIFSDYFNYYLPKMGTSLESICYESEFTTKEKVGMLERDAVSSLFRPPTANQSWRKVLSMGNLLNGHEPIQREIVFSVMERVSNGHYSSPTPLCTDEQVETHRMYISGTSNDLWVALSVTSWD
ncbi:rab3 GTPase-activating protein catalytic subunit isoform X2 [Brachypodium distachyon]|uniref:rab3 GTPase-activating protein catalytic subunit isoform X2 n=1 Tax=Brachypodium distachyon TaxID=15368 RepID=UPI00052FF6B1|nr:rab3 GTPase-activating protein catalytic subunit isoform X2 [Brachypodium distachyon]|eukprot:XP_010228735.1 rab3 GTPase-activating protein catalytic subunit isoform X2 [Brachypodium distachyon]